MLNRRSFLAVGAMGALSTVSELKAQPLVVPKKWDQEFDVVIVGAGGAGLACAIETVDRKLKTLILEKMPFIGGASALCGGQYSAAGTSFQKQQGIQDDQEHFLRNMLDTGGYANDPELVKAYIRESVPHFDWLAAQGVHPSFVYAPSGMDVPRAHRFDPVEVVNTMEKYVTSNGATILTSAPALRLLWDDQAKRIGGVKAEIEGKEQTIRAKRGVLLAAGGYCHNPSMLQKYVPTMKKAAVVAAAGATGDGINMALAYGADTLDTGYVRASFGYKPNPKTINDFSLVQFSGAILINKNGKRYANESWSYKELGNPTLDQPEGMGYAVFNDAMRRNAMKSWVGDKVLLGAADAEEKPDYLFEGKSLREAAQKAGLPVETVVETIERYNSYVKAGNDPEFGRNSLSSGFGKPIPLTNDGRIFIFPLTSGLMSTLAGVRITPQAEVLDIFGERIPGLYAAGEMTGGIHGAAYMTGTAFAKAMCFGRIAGRAISM